MPQTATREPALACTRRSQHACTLPAQAPMCPLGCRTAFVAAAQPFPPARLASFQNAPLPPPHPACMAVYSFQLQFRKERKG